MGEEFSQKTVLVADDDPDIRAVICSAISFLGITTLEAGDGQQALSIFESTQIDLAVLDVMMPNLTGLEVCDRIKKHPLGRYVPCIILTAKDNLRDKVSALSDGADDYLTKPFHYEELQARVRAQLRVRTLNLVLQEKNQELIEMQEKLIHKERQLLANQMAGTAAHSLGQPLSAILLNCHLIESLPKDDGRFTQALTAVKNDARRMTTMLEKLKTLDEGKTTEYYAGTEILELKDD